MKYLIILCYLLSATLVMAREILPLTKGITLAQVKIENKNHTLLIISDNDHSVEAVDLSEKYGIYGSLRHFYNIVGYAEIKILAQKSQTKVKTYDYNQLLSPAGRANHHLALGLNYSEHTKEVNSKSQPFLFAKNTHATRENSISVNSGQLLDYEVELCIKPFKQSIEQLKSTDFGLFLCGDFTERRTMLLKMDIDNIQTGQGFSEAKSKKNYFPTGPYLIITENLSELLNKTAFSLSLNNQIKQQAEGKQMIWSLKNINEHYQQAIKKNIAVKNGLTSDVIASGGVVLTGTPQGVLFRPPSLSLKIKSILSYLFSDFCCHSTIKSYVIDRHIKQQLENKITLQPDDKLLLQGDYLGEIKLTVISE